MTYINKKLLDRKTYSEKSKRTWGKEISIRRRENDTRSYSTTQRRQNSSNERANFMLERKRKAA